MSDKNTKAAAQPAATAIAKPTNGDTRLALTAPFGDVYVKVTKDGQILRPIRATVKLFEKIGHFYGLPGKWNPETKQAEKAYALAYPGYVHLNKVASVSILTPPTVVKDGVEQPNPCVERNPKTRAIESVIVRKIGIGYSPAGNLVAIDKTLYYNPYTYFVQSIQAKMNRKKWTKGEKTDESANPNAALVGVETAPPDRAGSWVFFPIELPLGLWVNYEDPAIIDCLEEHTSRQRFGDRVAQTIVERNILKDHPAIGVSKVLAKAGSVPEQGQYASVDVFGYRHDLTFPDLRGLLKQAARGTGEIEVKAEVVTEIDGAEERIALSGAAEEDRDAAGAGLFQGAPKA